MSTIRIVLLFYSQVCYFGEEAMLSTQWKLFMVQCYSIINSDWSNSIDGCTILEFVSTARVNWAWNCHLCIICILTLVLCIWSLCITSAGTLTRSLLRYLWEDSKLLNGLCSTCNAVIGLLVLLLWELLMLGLQLVYCWSQWIESCLVLLAHSMTPLWLGALALTRPHLLRVSSILLLHRLQMLLLVLKLIVCTHGGLQRT